MSATMFNGNGAFGAGEEVLFVEPANQRKAAEPTTTTTTTVTTESPSTTTEHRKPSKVKSNGTSLVAKSETELDE